MASIALLLKSYQADAEYARRLINSFLDFNSDGLALHCIVPKADLPLFAPMAGETVIVYAEEDVLGTGTVRSQLCRHGNVIEPGLGDNEARRRRPNRDPISYLGRGVRDGRGGVGRSEGLVCRRGERAIA